MQYAAEYEVTVNNLHIKAFEACLSTTLQLFINRYMLNPAQCHMQSLYVLNLTKQCCMQENCKYEY